MKNSTYDISNIYSNFSAKTRAITAENPNGEKSGSCKAVPDENSPARELGVGWKVRPCVAIEAGETFTMAEIEGPGLITHMWMTCDQSFYRDLVIRMYWDNEEAPSVEAPLGDFFANGWGVRTHVMSIPVNVNPSGGFNSYWPMPFRKKAKITIENQSPKPMTHFFYQVDYLLQDIADDAMYFHARWHRSNPLEYGTDHVILDGVKGKGRFVGTYIAWGQNSNGWWGEGEVKFFYDGDEEFPTYCATGTEDYFGGAFGFFDQSTGFYDNYTAPYAGFHQTIIPDGKLVANMRHGMYRWHILDPVFFDESFKATVQALGWRSEMRFLPLQDDIASTAFWYQLEPHVKFEDFADRDAREVI